MKTTFEKKKYTDAMLVMIPPDYELGPAMKVLNKNQQAFVMACVNMGVGVNHAECARLAGYSDTGDGAKVRGFHLAHDTRIQEAIQEIGRKRLKFLTLEATTVLADALTATKHDKFSGEVPDWKTRLGAADSILDRGGLHALSEHHVTVTRTQTREEKILEISKLAKMLGKDPRELLGNMADAIEGDFKTVKEVGDGQGNAENAKEG